MIVLFCAANVAIAFCLICSRSCLAFAPVAGSEFVIATDPFCSVKLINPVSLRYSILSIIVIGVKSGTTNQDNQTKSLRYRKTI